MAVDYKRILDAPTGNTQAPKVEDLFLKKPVERITTSMDIDCALKQIQHRKSQIEAKEQERDRLIEEIHLWLAEVTKEDREEIDRLEGLLREYHECRLKENPREKTVKRPFGKLMARKSPDKWDYREDDLLRWMKENRPDLVRVKEEPNKRNLKKKAQVKDGWVYTEDGERVEGVMVTPGEIKFKVEVE
ncbi:host-nuclease inhibitor Gam family protein [Paludifilum halophilum]|nr:host-nuclease inhibitor Gam family protein [Paludifilum halophilum]